METTQTRSFARTLLPWLVAAVMLLVYLFTLNTTVTAQSVFPLARAAGMDWHTVYLSPVTYLLTFPVRWLPSGAQLFTVNFISALCGAISLGLLARSVALLPHDRTQLQRDKALDENAFPLIKLAWVPVVFAVLVAGLQRSFWENAVVGTGEMIDLLLFAYGVRCLLEYRVEERNSWLYRMAVVYGAGITNNFAMIAFLPVLLVSLVWIKGWRFFRFDFLVKMFLFALAGLSLYLILPLVNLGESGFWMSLKTNLVYQKQFIFGLRKAAIVPAIYCLVPLVLLGVKWPSGFGDQSPVGSVFANLAAVLLHVGLLVFCVYVAFDPQFSPRQYAMNQGLRFVFLPAYFLGALIVGYFSGFLLIVFSPNDARARRRATFAPVLNYVVAGIVCIGAAAVAGRLIYQNLPSIRAMNSPSLHQYAQELVKSLPEKPAVILSDDPVQLHAVENALRGRHDYLFVDALALGEPAYHRFLQRRYGSKVPKVVPYGSETFISSPHNIQTMETLRQTRELVYLHPSFGYLFEAYYLEPKGLSYSVKVVPPSAINPPPPSDSLIASQQTYWNSLRDGVFKGLKRELASVPESQKDRAALTSPYVAGYYSRGLDFWGVELQRAGRYEEAAVIFAEALALNSDNASAAINAAANAQWRKNRERLTKMGPEEDAKLNLYRGSITAVFTICGPIDEPSFLAEFAAVFTRNNLYRQAQRMLVRALDYVPDDIPTQMSLANVCLLGQQPELAIRQLKAMRGKTNWAQADMNTQVEAARIEASAYLAKGSFVEAEQLLKSLRQRNPEQEATHYALAQLYSTYATELADSGRAAEAAVHRTNAVKVMDGLLQLQPTNAVAWFTAGNIVFQTGNFERAERDFSKVLELAKEGNKAALFNRAMTYLLDGLQQTNELRKAKLQLAKADYSTYKSRYTPDYRIYFGLGEIAYDEKDWKTARENYENYLEYADSAKPEEKKLVRSRLAELRSK
jgi:tetratricopeptide (TPR) repeat protein